MTRAIDLFGAWRLVSLDAIRPNGETITGWMGPRPSGVLLYDPSGVMSVQMMSGPSERSVATYYAYFGAFEIDDRSHTIVHNVLGSMRSEELGVAYLQDFDLSDDRLILLTARHLVDREERRNRIEWERFRAASQR